MKLVVVYGHPAAGRCTLAARLTDMTGLALFRDHLVLDTVASVFTFGLASFVRFLEQFWMNVLEAAAAEGRSLIFMFQPEGSVYAEFTRGVMELARRAGSEVLPVDLQLSAERQMARTAHTDRARFGKLRDADLLAQMRRSSRHASALCRRPILSSIQSGFEPKPQPA